MQKEGQVFNASDAANSQLCWTGRQILPPGHQEALWWNCPPPPHKGKPTLPASAPRTSCLLLHFLQIQVSRSSFACFFKPMLRLIVHKPENIWFILNLPFCGDFIGLSWVPNHPQRLMKEPGRTQVEPRIYRLVPELQKCIFSSWGTPTSSARVQKGHGSFRHWGGVRGVALHRRGWRHQERKQMRDRSADPGGDVSGDQSCFCSVSSLVTLVFLDFAPAESEGLDRIRFPPSSWRTDALRASGV